MNSRYEKNKQEIKETEKEIKRIKRNEHKKRNITIVTIIITIIVILLVWGKFGATNTLKTNYFDINSSNIPESFKGVKIVHFSDIHYGTGVNEKKLNKIVSNINEQEPDIVVFTGDLIDKNYKETDKDKKIIIEKLSKIKAKLGKYAITGDNDYNNNSYENIIYDSGFMLLKNNYDTIYYKDNSPILIYGFDDVNKGIPETEALNKKNIKNISYKIALVHEPDYTKEIANDYDLDLVFAGHSLYGQVNIPLIKKIYLPKGAKKYYKKTYKVNDTELYISGGCGQTKYNYRLFTLPSINVYTLNNN